ncbi:MAG: class I SAM-dependent methyltransferase [Gaiellaceae bacterium]
MASDLWWRGFDALLLEALPPRSRVLDVGCGDGGLVERLAAQGLDAVGVDPNAPARPRLIRERVEDASSIGRFDAVCSVMALHHAELEAVLPAIVRMLRPGGRLFVSEFSWEGYDERAAGWVAAHGGSTTVEDWRAEHGDLHTGAVVQSALAGAFDTLSLTERPYLARMVGQPMLEREEQRLMEEGALPAFAWWYCGVAKS